MMVDANGTGVADRERAVCVGCTEPGCELCDPLSPEVCKICESPLLNHVGKCWSSCPSGWKQNPDGISCVEWTYNDLEKIPFPFLTLAFVLCMIACCGKCKKKKSRGGKSVSTQNTITCFVVVIAFVQFLAVIGLIIWALLFESKLLFIVIAGILLLLLFMNIIF